MTPLKITLEGAHGVRAGLGRDTLTMDLSTIPDDALTVAIRGDNGSGKSTLMNLGMTPWLEPPQIAGTIYDEFGETGLRELLWSHGEETYRSRIEYRNKGKTKSTRAYLHLQDGADWKPVALPDNTVSDGKVGTYRSCLEHILGPQEIYYLSAFRAQNAPKLAEYGDPKGLMRALLALDEPAELSDRAKDVSRELRRHLEVLRQQTARLDGYPDRIDELQQDSAEIDAGSAARAQAKFEAIEATSRARAELDAAVKGDIDRQRLIEQRVAVARRLKDAEADANMVIARAEEAIAAANARLSGAKHRGGGAVRQVENDIEMANRRVAEAKRTLEQRDSILAAQKQVSDLTIRIAGQERTVEALREQTESIREIASRIHTLKVQSDHLVADGKRCSAKVLELKTRAGFISQVPCRGEGDFATCPALQEAIEAESQVSTAETEVAAKREEWRLIDQRIKALFDEANSKQPMDGAFDEAKELLRSLRDQLRRFQQTAARASALEMAETNLAEAEEAVSVLGERLDKQRSETQAEVDRCSAELDKAKAAKDAVVSDTERTLAGIRAELSAIPEPGTDEVVAKARQSVQEAEALVEQAKAAMDQATARKAAIEAESAELRGALDHSAETLRRAKALEEEIGYWNLLAMGLRGVIDLSIEDAGPAIASTANRLLAEAYGPRFSVRIITQREQANGRVVETFDIGVLDAESRIEASILKKSGGESVWLDKALTDAVGLHHQDAAGMHYECLFADESEDGLTQERKAQFYRMDRAALELGRYRRKFFISHNPDAWDYADHVIDMARLEAA